MTTSTRCLLQRPRLGSARRPPDPHAAQPTQGRRRRARPIALQRRRVHRHLDSAAHGVRSSSLARATRTPSLRGCVLEGPNQPAVLRRLRDVRADVVVANEFEALPIALRLGPPVVFDAHEYSPDQWGERRLWRLLIAPYSRWQCRRYIPQVSRMTTVGQGIADEYEREIGVRATVVTNAPSREDLEPTPVHDPVRILHHGLALPGRGLPEMVRLADLLDERFTLEFVLAEGRPGFRDKLIRAARRNPRVRFPKPRPMHELVRMANDYDIGLYSAPAVERQSSVCASEQVLRVRTGPSCRRHRSSPEMARLVHQYGCGIVADDFTPESLAPALNALDESGSPR